MGRTKHQKAAASIKTSQEKGGLCMIVRIKSMKPLENYLLSVVFDDNKAVIYDMKDDIKKLPNYNDLQTIKGLWQQAQLDESRTCVYWNDYIDLPSDIIYEYGTEQPVRL